MAENILETAFPRVSVLMVFSFSFFTIAKNRDLSFSTEGRVKTLQQSKWLTSRRENTGYWEGYGGFYKVAGCLHQPLSFPWLAIFQIIYFGLSDIRKFSLWRVPILISVPFWYSHRDDQRVTWHVPSMELSRPVTERTQRLEGACYWDMGGVKEVRPG